MTPANIAGMGFIKDLSLMALTDHNTSKNTPAFFEACEAYGIIPVAGMELTTAEEVHMLCLFPTLESALAFDEAVDGYRMKVKNKSDIFGTQNVLDSDDNIIGNDPFLLPIATMLTLEDAYALAVEYGGACMPAHIDRPSNGILAILGTMPEKPDFHYVELRDRSKREEVGAESRHVLVNSDAHWLEDINEPENSISLDVSDGSDADMIRKALIKKLRGE